MEWLVAFLIYIITVSALLFLCHCHYKKFRLVHLIGFWYLDKKGNTLVQYFNREESKKVKALRKDGRYAVIRHTYQTMRSAVFSLQLKPMTIYYMETHLIGHLLREQDLEILASIPKRERYLWETIAFLGVRDYLQIRFSKKASEKRKIFITPCRITFQRKEG